MTPYGVELEGSGGKRERNRALAEFFRNDQMTLKEPLPSRYGCVIFIE
jgi:hypothetical protein